LRPDFLPFHVPDIGEEEIAAVAETMRSGWLTSGPRVRAFEENFAAKVGAPYAIAVNSGTAALHLALEALDLRPGDEVVVPTMTFAATGEVVCHLGATPRLVDCDPATLNLSLEHLASVIGPRTRAVVPVHFAGLPCDMAALTEMARKHRFKLIEDAAHAFPCRYGDRSIGSIGDLTCFSFYATKTITTGEGGMVTTASQEWADRIRMMSLHGISKSAWNRYTREGSWYYEIEQAGYKYNMTDIAAAIGWNN
jgi:perosamine synthetase